MPYEAVKTNYWRQKRAEFLYNRNAVNVDDTALPRITQVAFGGGASRSFKVNGDPTRNKDVIANVDTSGIRVGQKITWDGIAASTTITAVNDNGSITISNAYNRPTGKAVQLTISGLTIEDPASTALKDTNAKIKPITRVRKEDDYSCTFVGTLSESDTDMDNKSINEIGLLDENNQLVAFYHVGPFEKGPGVEFEVQIKIIE